MATLGRVLAELDQPHSVDMGERSCSAVTFGFCGCVLAFLKIGVARLELWLNNFVQLVGVDWSRIWASAHLAFEQVSLVGGFVFGVLVKMNCCMAS